MTHPVPITVRKTLVLMRRTKANPFSSSTIEQPWYWHATLGNGEIVAQGEEYEHKADMVNMLCELFDIEGENRSILETTNVLHWTHTA